MSGHGRNQVLEGLTAVRHDADRVEAGQRLAQLRNGAPVVPGARGVAVGDAEREVGFDLRGPVEDAEDPMRAQARSVELVSQCPGLALGASRQRRRNDMEHKRLACPVPLVCHVGPPSPVAPVRRERTSRGLVICSCRAAAGRPWRYDLPVPGSLPAGPGKVTGESASAMPGYAATNQGEHMRKPQ